MAKRDEESSKAARMRDFREPEFTEGDTELVAYGSQADDLVPPTGEQRDLAALMEELEMEAKANVTVYRDTGKRGSRGAYVMTFHPSARTMADVLDYLRDAKRGGDFRFYVSDGTRCIGNKFVGVEPPTPEEVKIYEDKQRGNRPYDAPAQQAPNEIALMLQPMRDDQQRRDEQYREEQKRRDEQAQRDREREEARQERERERQDAHNRFMMEIMAKQAVPQKSDLAELISAVGLLQGMNKQPEARRDSEIDILLKGIELRDRLAGQAPGAEESTLNTAIKHLGAPLATLAAKLTSAPAPNPLSRRPVPTPAQPMTAQPVPEKLPAPDVLRETPPPTTEEKLFMLYQDVINAAEAKADPSPFADRLIDILGEDAAADIVSDDAKWEFVMSQLGAEIVSRHAEWFAGLREYMVDSLFEIDEDAANDEPSGEIPGETGG